MKKNASKKSEFLQQQRNNNYLFDSQGASSAVGATNAPSISPGCVSATGVQSGTISPGGQSQTSNAAAPPIQSSCKYQ